MSAADLIAPRREPLVKLLPHNPKAHIITNPAIYRWKQQRAA